MKAIKHLSLSVLSGILLSLSWPEIGNQAWLIFIAFIPLFISIDKIKNWRTTFLYAFLSFMIWHILSCWWMWPSTPIGSVSAWIINSMLMAGIISLAKHSSEKIKWVPLEIILAFYWLSFEIFHLFWDLKWPWMNLGHVFANHIEWIQWYEYLGVYGGGFWIIIVNGLVFRLLKKPVFIPGKILLLIFTLISIIAPISFSFHLLNKDLNEPSALKVSIIQPNVNTYTEKFDALTPLQQSEMIIKLLENTDSNSIIILPETAIPESFNIKGPYPKSIDTLLSFSGINHLKIIGGYYTKDEKASYNSACLIANGRIIDSRNKIKLLAYAEQIPFEFISGYWSQLVHEQGGISKSFGVDEQAKVFNFNDSIKLGTLICFESVFSDIATEMCRKGSQALIVITNDDWWLDTPGHRQHFAYARIKAIETRKWIARSANTGISGIINPKGEIIQSSDYRTETIIKGKVNLNSKQSFFVSHEKQLRWLIIIFSIIIFLSGLVLKWISRVSSVKIFTKH